MLYAITILCNVEFFLLLFKKKTRLTGLRWLLAEMIVLHIMFEYNAH